MAQIPKKTKGSSAAVEPSNNLTLGGENLTGLNFKVPLSFRIEFKTVAAQNNLKLVDLLQKSLECFKSQNSGKPANQQPE